MLKFFINLKIKYLHFSGCKYLQVFTYLRSPTASLQKLMRIFTKKWVSLYNKSKIFGVFLFA